jgi:hypothetical protein
MSATEIMYQEAVKWKSFGIDSFVMKVEAECGSKKLSKKFVKLDSEILLSPDNMPNDVNFFGIFLDNSGLVCLDIEHAPPGSVQNFFFFLEEVELNPDTFLMENSLNGGLHIFFRSPNLEIETKHFLEFRGIGFDFLTKGRVFTSPSFFKQKKYQWWNGGIREFESKKEIQIIPSPLLEMVQKSNCWKRKTKI